LAGIYIHIPFCKQACNYCNFHFSTQTKNKGAFLSALINEISLKDDFINPEETIETIYFGGGTPSLLNKEELNLIFVALNKRFKISKFAEITLEANPDDINSSQLKDWHKLGVNRLSLGIQSFNNDELSWMNRAHNAAEANKSINEILDSEINNFSIDLIFGSPLLNNKSLAENLNIILEKNIPHLSCYALTVENKTLLHRLIKEKKITNIDIDKQAEQFLLIEDTLINAGYEHYEISNYAKPGMESKHNSSYWKGSAYYGFGPSAHSFDGKNIRRWNVSNNAIYINQLQSFEIPYEEEILSPVNKMNEFIMTGIRMSSGLKKMEFIKQFGEKKYMELWQTAKPFFDTGKIVANDDGNIVLTKTGKLFADGIAAELFFE
jgi:oxygen-independent coproporphyrinogen-3 oxidase